MQVKRGGGRGVLAFRDWKFPLRRPRALQIETSSVNCDIDSIKSPEIKYSGCELSIISMMHLRYIWSYIVTYMYVGFICRIYFKMLQGTSVDA